MPDRRDVRTEFGTVLIQDDVCNGCGYCVPACPFGVIARREDRRRRAQVHAVLRPPGGGPGAGLREGLPDRRPSSSARWTSCASGPGSGSRTCTRRGQDSARLYLDDPADGIGGGGAFFLLLDEPEVYGLPPDPVVTTRDLPGMWKHVAIAAAGLAGAAVALGLGRRR